MQNNLFNWTSQNWLTIDQIGILVGLLLGILQIILLLVAIFKRKTIRRWLLRNRFPNIGRNDAGKNWHGILFTVSQSQLPCWIIKTKKPQIIGLIASRQSHKNAREIQECAEQLGVRVIPIIEISDPDDTVQSYQKTRQLIKEMRPDESQAIAVDITGGKRPMSMGAFMAAVEAQADTLYISADFDANLKQPDLNTAHILTLSSPEKPA